MLKEISMKEPGMKIKPMVTVSILTMVEVVMKVNGSMINSMVMEMKNGLMAQNIQANIIMD